MRWPRKLTGTTARFFVDRLIDRIDLYVELHPVAASELLDKAPGECSADVRKRVEKARGQQRERGQTVPNGRLAPAELEAIANTTREARELMYLSVDAHGLSGRAANRLLKVARTIADLAGDHRVDARHLGEAFAFRPAQGLS